MRRAVPLFTLAVGLLFAALAIPGSPARLWFAELIGDRPDPSAAPRDRGGPAAGAPLRVAVGAMISPERTYVFYTDLFRLLAGRVGRPLELKQRRTYRELNGLIREGAVDVAWICTGAWPELAEHGAARLLAVPVVGGRTTYNALVLAGPAAAGAAGIADLAGVRFAFTDPISLTGCLYPQRRVRSLGLDSGAFFAEVTYTGGHDRSIEAVRRGLVGGASVDSLVYEYLAQRFPEEIAGISVLETSPPFPIPPIVVPITTDKDLANDLERELMALASGTDGRALLSALLIDGFARPDTAAYGALR